MSVFSRIKSLLFFLSVTMISIISCDNASPDISCDNASPEIPVIESTENITCNDAIRARSLLSATLIKNIGLKRVIEINGFCDPLCVRLPGIDYTGIYSGIKQLEPLPEGCKMQTFLNSDVFTMDFGSLNITEPFALVALGVDLKQGAILKNVQFLKDAINKASLVVFESSLTDAPRHDQLLELIELSKNSTPPKKEMINVNLTINNEKMGHRDRFRHLVTFEKE